MRKWINRLIFLLVIASLISLGTLAYAKAAEQVSMPDLQDSITGEFSVELAWTDEAGTKQVFSDIVLQVYKVADLSVTDGKAAYTLTSAFEGCADPAVLTTEQYTDTAEAFAKKAVESDIAADVSGVTDANGCTYFSEMAPGMYLVMMKEDLNTKTIGLKMSPYLVPLPMADDSDGKAFWNYIVSSHPKTLVVKPENKGRIEITKKTSMFTDDGFEPLTVLKEVFYFGLFLDEEATQPYTDNFMTSVSIEGASSGTAVFENLPFGTYYVFETDASGMPLKNGEKVDDPLFSYTCIVESETQQVVFDPDWTVEEGKVVINNTYDGLPEGYYYEAKLHITKKVMKDSKEIETDETFYAGIFTEVDGGYALDQVVELVQNGTVVVPLSIQTTEGQTTQKYLVFETDKDGNRVNKETFGYIVAGEGSVEVSITDTEAEITIINNTPPDTPPNTPPRTPRTGDDSPLLMYAAIMAVALFVIIVLLVIMIRRRRR